MKPRNPEASRLESEYLQRLRAALAGRAPSEIDEIVQSVTEHIEQELPAGDGAEVTLVQMANVLEGLGPPEAYVDEDERPVKTPGTETAEDSTASPARQEARPIKLKAAVIFEAIAVIALVIYAGALIEQGGTFRDPDTQRLAPLFLLLCIAPGTVFSTIVHYRCWRRVPESDARISPAAAVGLLFVPFFHYYWYFVSFVGLAEDLNGKSPHAPGRARAIALGIVSIMLSTSFSQPLVMIATSVAWFILWLLYTISMVSQANRQVT